MEKIEVRFCVICQDYEVLHIQAVEQIIKIPGMIPERKKTIVRRCLGCNTSTERHQ